MNLKSLKPLSSFCWAATAALLFVIATTCYLALAADFADPNVETYLLQRPDPNEPSETRFAIVTETFGATFLHTAPQYTRVAMLRAARREAGHPEWIHPKDSLKELNLSLKAPEINVVDATPKWRWSRVNSIPDVPKDADGTHVLFEQAFGWPWRCARWYGDKRDRVVDGYPINLTTRTVTSRDMITLELQTTRMQAAGGVIPYGVIPAGFFGNWIVSTAAAMALIMAFRFARSPESHPPQTTT